MRWWQVVAICGGIVLVCLLLLFLVPGGEAIRLALGKLAVFCLRVSSFLFVLTPILAGVGAAGWFAWPLLSWLDERFQPNQDLSQFQKTIMVLEAAILAGLVQLIVAPWLVEHTMVRPFFVALNLGGPFETPPIFWLIWGMVAFLLGYLASWLSD